MIKLMFILLFVGCGDNIVPAPDAAINGLPSCASLGCPGLQVTDKQCADSHECICYVERNKPGIPCSIE